MAVVNQEKQMRYTTRRIESARSKVTEMERRIADQRRIVNNLTTKGYLLSDGLTQLAIMEQGLVQLRKFLVHLESRQMAEQGKPQLRCNAKRPSQPEPKTDPSPNIDILETAEAVIQQHGKRAPLFCARKMVDMLERGKLNRVATWLAIRHATLSLLDE